MIRYCLIFLLLFSVDSSFAAGWIKRANLGGVARHRATGVSIGEKGYIGLGHVNGTGINYAYEDWWEYDPSTNSWTQKANYMGGLNYGALAFSSSQYGFVGGGVYDGNSFYRFDPSTNTWSSIASCPTGVSDVVAMSINGKGFVVDGSAAFGYEPSTDTWYPIASPPAGGGFWNSTFTIGGSGYLIAGSNVLEYKEASDQWIFKAPFPGFASGGHAGFSAYDRGYVVCGYSGSLGNVTDECWEYNPADNSWSLSEEFAGTSRRFLIGFSIGNRGYIGVGTNGTNFKDFWEFNRPLSILSNHSSRQSIVYPNPCIDQIQLKLPINQEGLNPELLRGELMNLNGKIVKQLSHTELTSLIHIDEFSSGTYLLNLYYDDQLFTHNKIIKQ